MIQGVSIDSGGCDGHRRLKLVCFLSAGEPPKCIANRLVNHRSPNVFIDVGMSTEPEVIRIWTIPRSHALSPSMMRKSVHTRDYAVFLELLIEFRHRAGLTQIQLGQQLPFEQPAISKIERGERRVDVIELKLICEPLGVSLQEFITELQKRLEKSNAE